MSDLLTRDEYAALASSIDYPRGAFIDGKFRPGRGAKMKSINSSMV